MFITKKHTKIITIVALSVVILGLAIFGWLHFQQTTKAADMRQFNAGNIMSDAVMSNKNSMSVQQIQAFLTNKNPCNDTATYKAAWYPNLRYNIRNGKFVCISNETFNGESAAQIIWQTGQDYNINPQVLIVLLEKEQGLISDTWPNHRQYQTAVGFGCPDTAPCDAQYYGLKNQLRQAANLFRNVLNGGWSNYPIGNTYVQYNPNPACGGSVVNIQNRATSALYRYTPYQPNQSALNAGYGTGDGCGAYGNRNFWGLFTDWFGSTQASMFSKMDVDRKLVAKNNVSKVNPVTGTSISGQKISKDQVVKYSSKTNVISNNKLCLRTESNTNTDQSMCVVYENLQEGPSFSPINNTRLIANTDTSKVDPIDNTAISGQTIDKGQIVEYTSQATTRLDNKACLRTRSNTNSGLIACVPREKLSSVPSFSNLNNTKLLVTKNTIQKIDPYNESSINNQVVQRGTLVELSSQISTYKTNRQCLRTISNTQSNKDMCILASDLKNYVNPNFTNMDVSRKLTTNKPTSKIDPTTGEIIENLPSNLLISFSQKTFFYQGKLCLRTTTDTTLNKQTCVLYDNLSEL